MDVLEPMGWDAARAQAFAVWDGPTGEPARVTAQQRDRWSLRARSGAVEGRLLRWETGAPTPVTGDWVVCRPPSHPSDPLGIVAILPRRTAVLRGSAGTTAGAQVLAANVDHLWIVRGLDTAPNLRSLERYLAVAWESGASPEIVLTKSDLAEDREASLAGVRAIAFGVPVHAISITDADSVAALRDRLVPGETVALLGPSGAGKSTLINALASARLTRTGEVRASDRKGRHTTTARELFAIPGGALLLDTPGLRELRVIEAGDGVERAFPDIDALSGGCRFRDCSHTTEPGCEVLAAVEAGTLSAERLESYRKLQADVAYARRKDDPRAQAAYVAEHKTALRTLKHHPKYRRDG
ncbi:MAG: ribosome small subunit-dependent GTPase A [Gemmatimonadota bacterium]